MSNPKGYGIVKKIGWTEDAEGARFFGATIEFPDGPPDLPFSVVWLATPIMITIAETAAERVET